MKLVCTITDVGALICAGGAVESVSAIIEIHDEQLPWIVKKHLAALQMEKENPKHIQVYTQLSFSVLQED